MIEGLPDSLTHGLLVGKLLVGGLGIMARLCSHSFNPHGSIIRIIVIIITIQIKYIIIIINVLIIIVITRGALAPRAPLLAMPRGERCEGSRTFPTEAAGLAGRRLGIIVTIVTIVIIVVY